MIQNFNLKVYKTVTKTSVLGVPNVITETSKEVVVENLDNKNENNGKIYYFP